MLNHFALEELKEQTRPQQSCTLSTNLLECYADSVVRNDCSVFLQKGLRGLQLACCNQGLSELYMCWQVAVKLLMIKSSLQVVSVRRLRVVQRDIRDRFWQALLQPEEWSKYKLCGYEDHGVEDRRLQAIYL